MSIDVLYVAWNRLDYTRESFTALVENTNWKLVNRLYVHDDGSTDGTADYLASALPTTEVLVTFGVGRVGGPVATMNWYLDQTQICKPCNGSGFRNGVLDGDVCLACDGAGLEKPPDVFAKVDNDFVVCPQWLDALTKVFSQRADLDVLGVEPWFGDPQPGDWPRTASEPVEHVGGKGLIRRRIFSQCRPQPGGFNGYQGWTQYQQSHPQITKAWIAPDLKCFGLDQLPDPRWRGLAESYAVKGWGRLWPEYGDPSKYTSWWNPTT